MSEISSSKLTNTHPPLSEKTSSLLKSLLSQNTEKFIHLGYLIEQFKGRSFGGLLLMLSILALLPIISFVAGMLILIVGVQMLLGISIPVLPNFIIDKKVDKRNFEDYVNKALPWLVKSEHYIRPRWLGLTKPFIQRCLGLLIILLALVSLMPLPLSNMPPSIALILIALGIMERDGILLTIGIFISFLALLIGYFILSLVINSISLMV